MKKYKAFLLSILAGIFLAVAYAVCVIRGAIEWVTDVEGEAE